MEFFFIISLYFLISYHRLSTMAFSKTTTLYYQRFMGNYFPTYEAVYAMTNLCDPNVVCETSLNYYNDWTAIFPLNSNLIYHCQNFQLFGPLYFGNNVSIAKTFTNISSHEGVLIEFDLMSIDTMLADEFFVDVDGVNYLSLNLEVIGENICLNSYNEKLYHVSLQIENHTSSNMTINFSNSLVLPLSQHSYGIQNFRVFLQKNCHISCVSCNNDELHSCIKCPVLSKLNSSGLCECQEGFYMETSQFTHCVNCYYNCKTCSGPSNSDCLSCFSGDSLSESQCISPINQIKYPLEFPSNETFNDSVLEGWEVYKTGQHLINTDCGFSTMVGGYGNFGNTAKMKKNFSLPLPHYAVQVLFNLYVIDSWDDEYFKINLDGTLRQRKYKLTAGINSFCGKYYKDQIHTIYEIFLSNNTEITLEFSSTLDSNPYDESWGINNFEISYFLCHPTCLSCSGELETDCLSCYGNAIYNESGNTCVCQEGFYQSYELPCKNNPFSECLSCSVGCKICSNETICETCQIGFYLYENQCFPCSSNCKTCLNIDSYCISCYDSFYLFENSCLEECPSYYWGNDETNECEICHDSCLNCTGPNENNCSSCYPNTFLYEKTCGSDCLVSFYKNEVLWECLSCDLQCETCAENSTNCLSCPINFFLSVNQCVENCPAGTFKNLLNRQCSSSCTDNCLTCVDSSNFCLSCIEGTFFLDNACLEGCPTHYFSNETNFCLICYENCYNCSGPLETDCINCNETYYLDANNACNPCNTGCRVCELLSNNCTYCLDDYYLIDSSCELDCPIGYYKDDVNWVCLECNNSCLSCVNDSNVCTACSNNNYLWESYCFIECPDGTYPNDTIFTCALCNESCKTCKESTYCESCYNNTYLKDNLCLIECPSTEYGSDIDNTCSPCNESCNECTDKFSTNCTKCYNGSYLFQNQCLPCSSSCKTCLNIDSYCTSCYDNLYLFENSCTEACPSHYWGNTETNECEICHDSCLNCTGPYENNCSYCYPNSFLYEKTCLSNCPLGFYNNEVLWECLSCDPQCETCAENSTNCLSCPINLFLNVNQCDENCPTGTFKNSLNRQCNYCTDNCLTCVDSSNFCLSCIEGTFFLDNACLEGCPTHYFSNETNFCLICYENCYNCSGSLETNCINCNETYYLDENNICNPCNTGCRACESISNNCTSCLDNYYLIDSSCEVDCPIGYYKDLINWRCQECDKSCLTCFGPNSNECNSCYSSDYLSALNECLLCDSSCFSCVNDSNVCTCPNNNYLWNSHCFIICPDGTYAKDNLFTCESCNKLCKSCADPIYCESCYDKTYLKDKKCLSKCPSKEYGSNIDNTCYPCNETCYECTDKYSTNCTKCYTGYFLFQNKCLPCSSDCKTCINMNSYCTSCNNNFYLFINYCLNECPANYWGNNQTHTCQKCNQSCLNCTGPYGNNCSYCYPNTFLYEKTCISNCPSGFYKNELLWECLSCDPQCETCAENSTNCLSCPINFFLSVNQCVENCPLGTFKNSLNRQCNYCTDNCLTCVDSSNFCLSCIEGTFFLDNACLEGCPTHYFSNETNYCHICYENCYNCSGSFETNCINCNETYYLDENNACNPCNTGCKVCELTSNNCTSCLDNYYLIDSNCELDCPVGYYKDDINWVCQECDKSCFTCFGSNSNECNSCNSSSYLTLLNECFLCNSSCLSCVNDSNVCTSCPNNNNYLWDSHCFVACPDGTFPNDASFTCASCNESCKTCFGALENECKSCEIGFFLSNSNECLLCNSSCQSCELNANNCSSCLSGTFLKDNFCLIDCPSTEYGSEIDNTCYPCNETCNECTDKFSNNCTKCYNGSYLFQNQCFPCSSSCKTCLNTDSYCTSCYDNLYLFENSCIEACQSHYWGNNETNECEICHENCFNCEGVLENNCKDCYQHFYLLENNTCAECDSICKTCNIIKSNCTSCYPDTFLLFSNCLQKCPTEGFYQIDSNWTCDECDFTCKECSGPSNSECINCFSDCYFSSNSCIFCNDSCLTCEYNENNCTSCVNTSYFLNFTCFSECPKHYYSAQNDNICRKCNENCYECKINETNCLSCYDGTFLKENQCLINCPEGDWENSVDNICESCHISCKTCSGAKENDCTECFPGYFLLNNTCFPCDLQCKTCLFSSDYCLNCNEDFYFLNNSCVTDCPSHYFLNNTNKSCTICHESCLNCSGDSSNQCVSCNEGDYLTNNTCQKCKTGCKNCYNEKNNCSNCLPQFYLWSNTCETRCTMGKFPNNTTWTCDLCNPQCRQCIGPLQNDCISCNIGTFLSQTNECLACNNSCLACENDANHCIYCISGLFLYNFTCFEQCPTGYFGRSLDNTCQMCNSKLCINCTEFGCNRCIEGYYAINSVCLLCNFECKTCDFISNNCTSCFPGQFLQDNSCKNQCNKGKWGNTIENRCDLCDASCLACTSGSANDCLECYSGNFLSENRCFQCSLQCETCVNSSEYCLSCKENFYFYENECLEECPVGYWADESSKTCKFCTNENCVECTGPSTCTQCIEGTYLIYGQCRECHSNCSKCEYTQDYCTECKEFFFFYQWKCLQKCPDGYWEDSSGNVCSLCDKTCLTCQNGTNSTCLSCAKGRYLSNNSCYACPKGCSECTSETHCTSCEKLYYLIENNCLDNCELGYYRNITLNKCMPCHSSCIDCDGESSNNCIKCMNNEVLLSGSCQKCDSNCSTCDGVRKTDCLSCISNYYLQDGMCVPACKLGYYLASNSCKRCSYSCRECVGYGEEKCKTCNQSQFLNLLDAENKLGQCFISCPKPLINAVNSYTCISECPPKTYLDTIFNRCIDCSEFCLTCEGSYFDQCLSCIDSKYLLNKRCYTECPNGYYQNLSTKTCEPCISHCLKCSTATECEECNDKYYRSIYDSQCILCNSSGTFLKNYTCGNCSYGCLICNSATNCSQCQSDFYIYFDNVTNETYCKERTHIMPQIEGDANIPMFYYLSFNDTWNMLFDNITTNKSSYTIRIEGISIRNFNYFLLPSKLKPNLWEIYLNLSISIINSTYLVLSIFPPNDKFYNLVPNIIQYPIEKYTFCGFNSYYNENNGSCQNLTVITPSLKLIEEQKVLLSFSGEFSDLFDKLTSLTLIYLENIPKNNYNASLTHIENTFEYRIEMEFNQSLLNKPRLIVEFSLPGNLLFHKTKRLYPTSLSIIIGEFFYISDLQAWAIDFLKNSEKITDNTLVPTALIHGVLCSGSFSFIGLTAITFIKYLRYLDLNYPPNALAVFESNSNNRFLPDLFTYNISELSLQLPKKFRTYNVKSGFLLNAQDEIFVCLTTIIIGVAVNSCLQALKKKGYSFKLFSSFASAFFLNIPLMFFFIYLLDLSFFSLTNMIWNEIKTTKGSINLISAILTFCSIFIIFKYIYILLKEFYPTNPEQSFSRIPHENSKEECQSDISSAISRKNIDASSPTMKTSRSIMKNSHKSSNNPFSLIAEGNVEKKVWWDVENLDVPEKIAKQPTKIQKKKMVLFKDNIEKYQYDINFYGSSKRDWTFINVLISDIKSAEGKYFTFFHMIRYLILAFIIAFLSENPYYACWSLLIIDCFFFLVFFIIAYFKSNLKFFQYFIMNLCQSFAIIGALTLAISEQQNDFDDSSRINKGWVIFYANLIALFTVLISFLGELFGFAKKLIRSLFKNLKKNKVTPKVSN